MSCPLCKAPPESEPYARAYQAWQDESSWDEIAAAAAGAGAAASGSDEPVPDEPVPDVPPGLSISADEARKHFQSHRVRPALRKIQRPRPQVIALLDSLSERQRFLIDLVWRVRAFSPGDLGRLAYLKEGASSEAARVDAQIGLRKLIKSDLLLRVFVEHTTGGANYPRDLPPKLFLGPAGRVAIDQRRGLRPQKGEWFRDSLEIEGKELLSWSEDAQVIVSFAAALERRSGPRRYRHVLDGHPALGLDLRNVFDARFTRFLHQADGRRIKIEANGLIALSFREGLAPCLLVRDEGVREAEWLIERLVRHTQIRRYQILGEDFPELSGVNPPVLVVCPDQQRVEELVLSSRQLSILPDLPLTLAIDRRTLKGHLLSENVWKQLFTAQPTRATLDLTLSAWAKQAGLAPDMVLGG